MRRAAASTAAAAIGRAEYGVGPVAVPEVVDVRQREGLGGVGGVAAPAQRLEGFPQERVQPNGRRLLIKVSPFVPYTHVMSNMNDLGKKMYSL